MAIRIIEKDDRISWEDLARIQYLAHGPNRARGVYQNCAYLSGDELQKCVGNGRCFVALDDDRPVGFACCSICKNFNKYWFTRGETIARFSFEAILPDFQGKGIYHLLTMTRLAAVKEEGAELVIIDTHERNIRMREIFSHYGFKELCWWRGDSCSYFSIVAARWVGKECPFTDGYICKKLRLSRLKIRLTVNLRREYLLYRTLSFLCKAVIRLLSRVRHFYWRSARNIGRSLRFNK